MEANTERWLSVHVFLADPGLQERYLAERVAPCVRAWRADGWLAHWFFIRYWEGGPHLRIRLAGEVGGRADAVLAALGGEIGRWRAAAAPSREAYYRGHAFDGVPVDPARLPWYPEGSVVAIDYEPETARYGGAWALPASEQLFGLSSELALGLFAQGAQPMHARLSLAFALMAAAALAIGVAPAGLAVFFERYAGYWARHSADTAALALRLAAQAAPVPTAQVALLGRLADTLAGGAGAAGGGRNAVLAWAGGMAGLAARLGQLYEAGRLDLPYGGRRAASAADRELALHAIAGSQLHMLNNRLGIVPAAELVLATTLARAAAQAAQPATVLEDA
jgi:hypothetical protein